MRNNKNPMQDLRRPLGIYVHVPFCRSKCEYCDFYSLGGGMNRESMDLYLQAVLAHIRESAQRVVGYEVDTVYFGGGTPSFFGHQGLIRILTEIDRRFRLSKDAEITLEANPDSVNAQSLEKLRRAGFKPHLHRRPGPMTTPSSKPWDVPHTYQQAQQAVSLARRAGFNNVSVDLMFGLPSQSRQQWMNTLRNVLDLKPDHLSCYGLKVEEGTRLYEYKDCANLPDDDAQADMYFYAVETLQSFGYQQYEISNFAKPGLECRHNLKYWMGDPYLGFGPRGGVGLCPASATPLPPTWISISPAFLEQKTILSACDAIPTRERAGEYLMLRLRTSYGIEENEYMQTYLLPFAPLEQLLTTYAQRDLAKKEENGRWRLTPKGFLVSNAILVELLEVQQKSSPLAKIR